MARARNIKPKFFTNPELVELPFSTRLLFIGLWTIADREGRLEDRPKQIKMNIFPSDDVDINAALEDLQKAGLLLRYEHDGTKYLQVLTFCKHQNPHKDEKASIIPSPKLHGATKVQQECNDDSSPALTLIPDSLNPVLQKPDSLKPEIKPIASRKEEYPKDFENAYAAYPSRPGSSKKKAYSAWLARLKTGFSVEDMTDGVRRYAAYVDAMKVDPTYIQMPATFFGPSESFRSNWTIQQARASPAYATSIDKHKAFADALTGRTKEPDDHDIIDIN